MQISLFKDMVAYEALVLNPEFQRVHPVLFETLENIRKDAAQQISLENFLLYASNRILDQALPTFFDGQVPSQRKLLLSMQDLGALPGKKFQKSSRITAQSAATYHPVGNTYGVLVNLSQKWKTPVMLTDPEGNWGEIESGAAAAERYTEIRMSDFGHEALFGDLPSQRRKSEQDPHGIVPSSVTYTDLHWEEDYFPARLPMLLLNGSNGIAIGIAQTFQPMAIRPLLRVLQDYLWDRPIDYTLLRLAYPTNPKITSGQAAFIDALKTGRGSVRTTAAYTFELNRNGQVTALTFNSTPPGTTLNAIGDALNEWRSGELKSEIDCPFGDMKNYTGAGDVRPKLTFPLRRPLSPAEATALAPTLIRICKLTDYQTVNMTALKGRYPVVYTLESFFKDWIEERSNIIQRLANKKVADLTRAKHRLDILVWARKNKSKLMEAIDVTPTTQDFQSFIRPMWQEDFQSPLTDEDTDIIFEINLRQLSKLNTDELQDRIARTLRDLTAQQELANNPEARRNAMSDDIDWFAKNLDVFGIPDYQCEFDDELGQALDRKEATKASSPSARQPGTATGQAENWYLAATAGAADVDILVHTAAGALIRVSNRSVKGTDYAPNLPDPNDKIVSATFVSEPSLLLLADNSKLVLLPKDALPYNTPIYPARVAQLVKSRTPFTTIVPATVTGNGANALLLVGETGKARRTPLSTLPTIRASVAFPEPVKYAALINDNLPSMATPLGLIVTIDQKKLVTGSAKRTGGLGKPLKAFGPFVRTENGNRLTISDDGRSINKVVANN